MPRASAPTVVAIGGHGFGPGAEGRQPEPWLLSLTGKRNAKVCFLPTASGDADSYIASFYDTFGPLKCRATLLRLFRRTVDDLRSFLLDQDLIYVGGGNTANMLAVWHAHGVVSILREAWTKGIVLAGTSAGALCWFDSGLTDSFGDLQVIRGLGLLPHSFCPHVDDEPGRAELFENLVARRQIPAGYAAGRPVLLRFEGTELADAISISSTGEAWKVRRDGAGARKTRIRPRLIT